MTFELDERHLGCKIFFALVLACRLFALFAPGELNRGHCTRKKKISQILIEARPSSIHPGVLTSVASYLTM